MRHNILLNRSKSVLIPLLLTFFLSGIGLISPDAQDIIANANDRKVCANLIEAAQKSDFPDEGNAGDRMITVAKQLLGTRYVASTLEKGLDEPLTITASGLDCTTLVELTMAVALTSYQSEPTFDDLAQNLEYLRYRNGKRDGYISRLHYFYEWIVNNEKKGLVENITKNLGGVKKELNLSFMSSNPKYYPFEEGSEQQQSLAEIEKQLNEKDFWIIPKNKLKQASSGIQNGDIIAFVANRSDLDFYHNGLAYWENGDLHVLHASSVAEEVVISDEPLHKFANIKRYDGIVVIRPLKPSGGNDE